MLADDIVPPEGGRYAAPVVLLPGLWAGREAWRRFATYLAHRGWECRLLDLRGTGGLEARATGVAAYLGTLPAPAVVVGHGAGALVAAEAGRQAGAAAVVMLAPLVPGDAATRTLVLTLRSVLGVALGRPVGPPGADGVALLLSGLPTPERAAVAARLGTDDGAALRDLVRGRLPVRSPSLPTLVLAGEHDLLLPPAAARTLAAELRADVRVVEGAGHWLLGGASWQPAVDAIHRWTVQRLGEPLLETYAETMADRDADDD